MRLFRDAGSAEKGGGCALKTKFRGGNISEREKKADTFALTACFTNITSQAGTLLERVHASHWWKAHDRAARH